MKNAKKAANSDWHEDEEGRCFIRPTHDREECDDAVRRREVSAVARGGGQRSDRHRVKAFLDETC